VQAAEHASTAPGGAWAPVSSASAAFVRIAFGVAIVLFARHLSDLHGGAEVRADA
jgi:hypothetical protein